MPRKQDFWVVLYAFIFFAGSVSGLEFGEDFNKTVDFIIKEIDRDNIANILRYLSAQPHVGGTPEEWKNAQYVADTWKSQGLDEIHLTPYEVLLSYPEMSKPNYVRIHSPGDEETWKSQGQTKPLHSKEEWSEKVLPDFNAFSPPGNVKGNIVLINFGNEKDFQKLEELGVNVSGNIVIARYGQGFRANIVKSAQDRGATGVLFYSDPQQYAQQGPNRVYPETVFMPGSAAPFGTTYLNDGDPLTPYYPSIESAFRIPEKEAALPKISVMSVSYDDAAVILSKMGGALAPPEWQGGLNFTYKIGPGLEEQGGYVSMEVHTHNQMTKTYNVIGMIKGREEPDRYVILGNHRDAWIFGALDPSSASTAMLELTRILTDYRKKTGWIPRRTLVFCSWGSEEYGLIGSHEWTEQFGKQLADRSIVYLNLDSVMEGNYTLKAITVPLVYEIAREISKLVPNPDLEEFKAGRTTVFDTWLFRNPDENKLGCPKFTDLGSGTDYKSFQHNLGVPSLEYRYTCSDQMFGELLHHTLYDTFYLMSELYDRDFNFLAAVTQLWALIGTYFADIEVIPFSLDEYAEFITDAQQSLFDEYGTLIQQRNITLDYFQNASKHFTEEAQKFKFVLKNFNTTNILAVRRINDQLMMVERAFIDPNGLPGRPFYNHVVLAPSSSDSYTVTAFAGLSDALVGIEDLPEEKQNQQWRTFEEHLAVCTHLLLTASKVLSDDLW